MTSLAGVRVHQRIVHVAGWRFSAAWYLVSRRGVTSTWPEKRWPVLGSVSGFAHFFRDSHDPARSGAAVFRGLFALAQFYPMPFFRLLSGLPAHSSAEAFCDDDDDGDRSEARSAVRERRKTVLHCLSVWTRGGFFPVSTTEHEPFS